MSTHIFKIPSRGHWCPTENYCSAHWPCFSLTIQSLFPPQDLCICYCSLCLEGSSLRHLSDSLCHILQLSAQIIMYMHGLSEVDNSCFLCDLSYYEHLSKQPSSHLSILCLYLALPCSHQG